MLLQLHSEHSALLYADTGDLYLELVAQLVDALVQLLLLFPCLQAWIACQQAAGFAGHCRCWLRCLHILGLTWL